MAGVMDSDFIRELFAEFGEVQVKRMFGGQGLYAGGLMFGLVTDGVIYLKADETTSSAYAAEDCSPFGFDTKNGRRVLTSYWRLPDRLYDGPSELGQWARVALAVAQSKKAMKKPAPKGRAKKSVATRKVRR